MLENFSKNEELKFKELSPEEKESRGILGRLYGPIASIVKATRNGRRYKETLWEKVFGNPLTMEMFSQGGIPGELDHPVDRDETCSEKIAIMMPEPPTKGPDGNLMGYFDIIDTPCGRIAYALAKYGFNLGISSRGSGDTYLDDDGEETVDEDSYSLNAFDLVLLPACKDARLKLAESLDKNKSGFSKAIQEALDKSDEGERKIMVETLENLKFHENKASSEIEEEATVSDEKEEAENIGDNLVNDLQEALKENAQLQNKVLALQEKLSVSYTKEVSLQEQVTRLKDTVKRLAESVSKSGALSKQLDVKNQQLEEQSSLANSRKEMIESYEKKLSSVLSSRNGLKENLQTSMVRNQELQSKISELDESVRTIRLDSKRKIESLEKELSELKTDSKIKNSEYAKKLERSNKLIESYRNVAETAVERYIQSKATNLGVSPNEIKNRLSEGYSFDDIDSVCESLRSYKRNISKLPFSVDSASVSRVSLKEDTSTRRFTNPDDVVDKELFELLNH